MKRKKITDNVRKTCDCAKKKLGHQKRRVRSKQKSQEIEFGIFDRAFLTSLIGSAVDYSDGAFASTADFFETLFPGVLGQMEKGAARLWVLMLPKYDDSQRSDSEKRLLLEMSETVAAKRTERWKCTYDINGLRIVAKTDANSKINSSDDIKAFFITEESNMGGLDDAVRDNGGIAEVQV